MANNNESIYSGQQLRLIRMTRTDYGQAELSVETDIPVQTISDWESKGFPKRIPKKRLDALCNALGCEAWELEKPLIENIQQYGLGIIQQKLLSPSTEDKDIIRIVEISHKKQSEHTDNKEQKDLTQIFNIGVANDK